MCPVVATQDVLWKRHLTLQAGQLSSCLIQSAAQTSLVSVLASGFCSVLVPLTQTSWQVFTFCSCFSLYPCFPSSSSSSSSSLFLALWVSVRVFWSQRHCTLPTLCKNGPSVCACVFPAQRTGFLRLLYFTHTMMSDRVGKLSKLNMKLNQKKPPLNVSQNKH